MALIIKCRKCSKRIPETATTCPACGSSERRYIVDYWPRGRNGGRKQLTLPAEVKSVAEAKELERSFLVIQQARRAAITGASPKSTVTELFPDYLKWYSLHRAASTYKDVSRSWELNLKPIFGSYLVVSIATEHFSLYQQVRAKKVTNRTVNKELDYFKGFLHWCRRERHMDLKRIEHEELPCRRPLPIVLSPDEVARILTAAQAEPLYHALISCLYTLGLRISEARGLKWRDFDFENQSIRVQQKGGAWKILPINDQVSEALKKLESIQTLAAKKIPKEKRKEMSDAYVFSVRKGEPIQNIRNALARICERAGVTKKVNPHLFRHSIATHLMGADVNMRTIQQYLGHTQVATTEFYTHVALGHLRNAQKTVELYKKAE